MKNTPNILCMGAFHWDLVLQTNADLILGESNPVRSSWHYGGVAFNVARVLTQLNCAVGLISRLGSKLDGSGLLDYLLSTEIEIVDIAVESNISTACYTTIMDAKGELILGLADMEIYRLLNQDFWLKILKNINKWNAWCIDTNLPESGISYLLSLEERSRTYIVVSSPHKSVRLRSHLKNVDTIFLNIVEASLLLSESDSHFINAEQAATSLYTAGVKRVIVTDGANGAAWADQTGSGEIQASHDDTLPIQSSGAGDALAAATIAALEMGHTTPHSMKLGMKLSEIFLSSPNKGGDMNWQSILNDHNWKL
ncbi:MAG: hypothetical protein CL398_02150 [Acidiferrobacteraceae bacterium]|nr:hypothetical protein [Acidiferrobacteraceae bacterium]